LTGSAEGADEPIFFASPAAWRAWLEANHAAAPELLVGFHKRATGLPSLTWPESVDQALCFGWIDGVRRSHGADAYTIRFTPRRPGSHWSAVNVAKVAQLTAQGRMRPAGLAAFQARREDRTAKAAHERVRDAELEPPEDAAFRADPVAWQWFSTQAPSYRRTALHWVVSAKRAPTRARRLETLIACSRAGRRVPPLARP
jgi:uncharacterized protein YdeI (YjbR/CyaY-like superfamily)